MKLMFVDEFIGHKDKKLFGLNLVIIDNIHYQQLHSKFKDDLINLNWPYSKEFKGKDLFSGHTEDDKKIIQVDETINFVKNIINNLSGDNNSKCQIISIYNNNGYSIENYCALMNSCIAKISKPTTNSKGKNNVCFFYDGFEDAWSKSGIDKVSDSVNHALNYKNYFLIEGRATPVDSHNDCVGTCYADILSYVIRWKIENPNFETDQKQQLSLFKFDKSDVTKEKMRVITEITDLIKNIKIIQQNKCQI